MDKSNLSDCFALCKCWVKIRMEPTTAWQMSKSLALSMVWSMTKSNSRLSTRCRGCCSHGSGTPYQGSTSWAQAHSNTVESKHNTTIHVNNGFTSSPGNSRMFQRHSGLLGEIQGLSFYFPIIYFKAPNLLHHIYPLQGFLSERCVDGDRSQQLIMFLNV